MQALHQRHAAAYRKVNVETLIHAAGPHQLITLLFDELMRCLNAARGAMASGDMTGKGAGIGKAVRILEEGLKAGLDNREKVLAPNLRLLYDGVIMRLTLANLRNDPAPLDEAVQLVAPIQDAWRQIAGATRPTPTH